MIMSFFFASIHLKCHDWRAFALGALLTARFNVHRIRQLAATASFCCFGIWLKSEPKI